MTMFSRFSRAIIFGRHADVAKRMLDFDFLVGRTPSVAGFIDPGAPKKSMLKVFFGEKEIFVPVYRSFQEIENDENIDTFLNFASHRSAASVTMDALESGKFSTIVIIAE